MVVPDDPFVMCVCGHASMDHGDNGCYVEIDDGEPQDCDCFEFQEDEEEDQ